MPHNLRANIVDSICGSVLNFKINYILIKIRDMNRRFWIYVCLGTAVGIGIGVGIGAGIWGEDEEVTSTTAGTLTSTATSKTTTASIS